MTIDQREIEREQVYFDAALEFREALRERLVTLYGYHFPDVAAVRRATRELQGEPFGDGPEGYLEPDAPAAFGRFDDVDENRLYVGYRAIFDNESNVLVANWRMPATRPFYEATPDKPGSVVVKRTYQAPKNRIAHIEETFLAELKQRVEELAQTDFEYVEDTLLSDLERGRSAELQDIVKTIQASQSVLMRKPLDQLLIIQGGPGTGKTAVALHRVSWLLYNYDTELGPEDVLIIGPSPVFTKYIRDLLPSLGDTKIAHTDLRSLGPHPATRHEADEDLARLKGDLRMAAVLRESLRQRLRELPDEYMTVGADRFLELSRDAVNAKLWEYSQLSPHQRGREALKNWVQTEIAKTRRPVTPADLETAIDRLWPRVSPQQLVEDLLGSRDRLLAAGGEHLSAADVTRLFRQAPQRAADRAWTDADVALLDEAQALISGATRTYRHIVLDEAQDLSPMQVRAIRRRSENGSYTIVGDLAQATGLWPCEDWSSLASDLEDACPVELHTLDVGYRVPAQLFAFASQLLPYIAPRVEAPRAIRRGPVDPVFLHKAERLNAVRTSVAEARRYAGSGMMVGVIAPESMLDELHERFTSEGIRWSDAAKSGLSGSINIVRPMDAKGLEFDAVIVVWPDGIAAEHAHGLRLLYIALTRATNSLTVIHRGSPLPLPDDAATGSDGDAGDSITTETLQRLLELRQEMSAEQWKSLLAGLDPEA